jgi:hypothetical protein
MLYDIHVPYDPWESDPAEVRERLGRRLRDDQEAVRSMLPGLRQEIQNPERDLNSVSEVLKPYHQALRHPPMRPEDLPEIEALCRLVLERGGSRQNEIQEVLLRLVGATAEPQSVPFLLDMWQYTRRGDNFGPERRQLAMWGLARIAIFHNVAEAYAALEEGLDDHRADVRLTVADLIINAYLDGGREVPPDVVEKLQEMARSDPDGEVRRKVWRMLHEPWAQE